MSNYLYNTFTYTFLLDITKRLGYIFGMLAACGHFCLAVAQPLKLDYGVNKVDINADGVNDMIVRTRWENMNAHSFDRYLMSVYLPEHPERYFEVSLGMDGADYRFHTTEGADCLVVGYNFYLRKGQPLEVVEYSRDAGIHHYCELQSVTVRRYKVSDGVNGEGMPMFGVPYFFLKKISEHRLLRKYESVEGFLN